jgi:hypothetical protein
MVKCCCGNKGYGKLSCVAGMTGGKDLYFIALQYTCCQQQVTLCDSTN